jgi:hypothetical protein
MDLLARIVNGVEEKRKRCCESFAEDRTINNKCRQLKGIGLLPN